MHTNTKGVLDHILVWHARQKHKYDVLSNCMMKPDISLHKLNLNPIRISVKIHIRGQCWYRTSH